MHIGIVGAGAIGGYLAAELSAAGASVTLVHRRSSGAPQRPVAVRVDGRILNASSSMVITCAYEALADVDVCLVAVKSFDTESVASTLAGTLAPDAPVVSFQNGLCNVQALRARLGERVSAGVVSYNVYIDEQGRRQQATAGTLIAGRLSEPHGVRLRALQLGFRLAGETLDLRRHIERVVAGKLLLNLNNGVCAATGLGIAESLCDRDARFCFAECLREGLRWMRSSGLRPARVTVLPPELLPAVLGLPDALVTRLARALVGVHAGARASTLQDLDRGRATEIGDLNGAIVTLARRMGGRAPHNELVTGIVREHERAVARGERPTFVSPRALRAWVEGGQTIPIDARIRPRAADA